MQETIHTILTNILTIIEFDADKEAYIKEFIDLYSKQVIIEATTTLPEEKQEELQKELIWVKDNASQKAVLENYISPDLLKTSIINATQKMFGEFIESITTDMPETMKNKLQNYLQSLKLEYPIQVN